MEASNPYDPYTTTPDFAPPVYNTDTSGGYNYSPMLSVFNGSSFTPSASTESVTSPIPTSGGGGGSYGPSAYGFNGTTGTADLRGGSKYGFQNIMWEALQRANKEMAAAGLGHFGITEGFRTYAGQVKAKQKWTAKGQPQMAATPGRSVHGLGLAADLKLTPAQFAWLKANGKRLGLVNLPSEKWHWQTAPSVYRSGSLPSLTTSNPSAPTRAYDPYTTYTQATARRVGL